MDQKDWLKRHLAFMRRDSEINGVRLPIRALCAIDAGGPDGAPMAAVHKALLGARLEKGVLRLIVERLEEDGHIRREVVQTGGRPRVQMWSFRHVLDNPRFDGDVVSEVAGNGNRGGRYAHVGKSRNRIVQEVIREAKGDLSIKDIEVGAFQIYGDINDSSLFLRTLFNGDDKKRMTAFLCGMAMSGYLANAGEVAGVRRWSVGPKEFPSGYQPG